MNRLKRYLAASVSVFAIMSQICAAEINLVPVPRKCMERSGTFMLTPDTKICLSPRSDGMMTAVSSWNSLMVSSFGKALAVIPEQNSAGSIRCILTDEIENPEGYRLEVTGSSVTIHARNPAGVFYAFQTLRQLLPPEAENIARDKPADSFSIPCLEIEDSPEFPYRGIMLDAARHFIPKEEVKTCIDIMAFHKLNVLHWHLTDDQGWRIEIKKYPKLTTVGGFRDKTIIGHARGPKPYKWNMSRYGGFYTQEDIKEVLDYAEERFVTVIPEIEMPGHSVAALSAYPEYSCSGGPFEVEGRWGIFNDVFCCKEKTFGFLQDILDEVTALFPSEYVHIGGDECPRVRWDNCTHCQARMKEEGLSSSNDLQIYFMNRIEEYLNSKGKRIIGWDEIMDGDISGRAVVMSWRGEKGGIKAAKNGYDAIMTPNEYMYFNRYQYDPSLEPLANGGFVPLEKVYDYHPVPEILNDEEARHIKGVQANLWTEYITSEDQLEYMLFPRTAALSEVAWSCPENRNYDNFLQRLPLILKHYSAMGINYCRWIFSSREDK